MGEPDAGATDSQFWTRPKKIGAAVIVACAIGGGGLLAGEAMGGSHHSAVGPSGKPSGVTQTESNHPTNITTAPSGTETGIFINGNEFSADKLEPTVPVAVPFTAGQEITKGDIEKLFHNIDVAINTQNLDNLLYSGIYPDSQYAENIQQPGVGEWWAFQSEKTNDGALVHTYSHTFYDKDVLITQATGAVEVITALGTDYDFRSPGQTKFAEYHFTVGPQEIPLPNGQTENLLTFTTLPTPTPTTSDAWYSGFSR